MKKEIIECILAKLSDSLDTKQQLRLEEVLKTVLERVIITPTESEERQREQANSELLKLLCLQRR